MNRDFTRGIGILLLTFTVTGCYTFAPAELAQIGDGESVRVLLTREGLDRVRESGEPTLEGLDRPVVRGVLVGQPSGHITLRVPVAVRETGFMMSVLEQQVTLPAGSVMMIESKRFSRQRTAALAVGAGALSGFVVGAILNEAIHPTGSGQPSYPQDARVPAFVP